MISEKILLFGFIAFIELYFLGMMFVLLNMIKLEQDKKRKKSYYMVCIT
jgi:hypothetical protein